jgi:hypothetical protein
MRIGTRVLYPEDVARWEADFLQISVYHSMTGNLGIMKDTVVKCRASGIRYVIHPVGYSLLDASMFSEIKIMAEEADLGMILHDERSSEGGRIEGRNLGIFRSAVEELRTVTDVSFENATSTKDVRWFWDNYADSITVDIGHVEEAGIDSSGFIKSLDDKTIDKIDYVHMHRNNGWHGGLTDHWPLLPDCREVFALRELLKRKNDVGVLLEINETEEIGESLKILREVRDSL